jgi:arylsulfatase A-like enzyme
MLEETKTVRKSIGILSAHPASLLNIVTWMQRKSRSGEMMEDLVGTDHEPLTTVYRLFNARDVDGVLRWMHPDVDWPNGMEGGRVHGHDEVRAYWTRQWKIVDPHVEPVGFETDAEGRTVVDVHQVVRDLAGKELLNQHIEHIYRIEGGLIRNMEIGEARQPEPAS